MPSLIPSLCSSRVLIRSGEWEQWVVTGRTIQEKRYRSMQEHIRRAHPEHYISKLPATEESFQLMINTPPSERPQPPPPSNPFGNSGTRNSHPEQSTRLTILVYGHDRDSQQRDHSSPAPRRTLEDAYPAAATAAVALAQLHNHRPDSDWESEAVMHLRRYLLALHRS